MQNKVTFIICLLVIFYHKNINGQNTESSNYLAHKKTITPEIIKPSPNVSALLKIEEVPVDNYSGTPNISIPLFSKSLFGFNYNLNLIYNPSGLRVDELATWVGTGWALQEGAVIGRNVVGLPDEKLTFGSLHNGYLDYDNLSTNTRNSLTWHSLYGQKDNKQDVNLDVYQFNIFGNTGRFIIIKNSAGNLEVKMIGEDSKVKIIIEHNNDFVISKFTVIDTNGFRYTMDVVETTSLVSGFALTNQFGQRKFSDVHSTTSMSYRSAWKISKVETSNNINICEFFYDNNVTTKNTPISTVRNTIISPYFDINSYRYDQSSRDYNSGILKPKLMESWNTGGDNERNISKIVFFDKTQIDFTTSVSSELGYRLSNFSIKNNENIVTSYSLEYEMNNSVDRRLFLMRILQHDNQNSSNTIDYEFSYNDKESLKGFGSTHKDLYGYYNGNDFDNSNKTYIKKGILSEIIYPTGGKKEFDFEANTFGFIAGRQLSRAELFENTDNRIEQTVSKTYTTSVQNMSYNNSNDSKQIVYINADQKVQLLSNIISGHQYYLSQCQILLTSKKLLPGVIFNPESNMNPQLYISDFIDDFSRPSVGIYLNPYENETSKLDLKEGFYFMEFKKVDQTINPEIQDPNNGAISVNLLLKHAKLKTQGLSKFLYGGGLRIKEIRFTDQFNIAQKTTYNYDMIEQDPFDLISGTLSSGSIDLYNLNTSYTITVKEIFSSMCDGVTAGTFESELQYKVENLNNPLTSQLTKGNYVGYKNVTISQMSNLDSLGRIVYTYSSPIDHSLFPQLYQYPFPPVPDTDYKRGNLLKTEIYNSNNQLLKKVSNSYDFHNQTILNYMFITDRQQQNCYYDRFLSFYHELSNSNNISSVCNGTISVLNCDLVNVFTQPSSYIIGKALLIQSDTEEYFYDNNIPSIVKSKNLYSYNLDNYQLESERYSFFENNYEVEYKTINSYPVGLNSNHPTYLPGESAALSKLVALNRINEKYHTMLFKNDIPISSKAITFNEFHPNLVSIKRHLTSKNHSTNNNGGLNGYVENYNTDLVYGNYDIYGNPLEIQIEDSIKTSYIWGYNHTQPVVKLENIAYLDIPSNLITAIQNATDSTTGTQAQVITALNALRTSTDVNLQKAMITTFTYKPLVGVTSVTDPRGQTTTYEYDGFGRLERVKDHQGNILSENEYHYRTQN